MARKAELQRLNSLPEGGHRRNGPWVAVWYGDDWFWQMVVAV